VPIDKFSLNLLRKERPKFASDNKINPNASMGWLKGREDKYLEVQKTIREICQGFPPIVFDLLAWDEARTFETIDKKNKVAKSKK